MLKRMLATTAVLALLALFPLTLAAQAHEKTAGTEMTITGQVIDMNCYVTNGASGAGHKACADGCAKAGVALGILSTDGTIYMPVSSKPGDPQNAKLAAFTEGKVKVTGMHRMANGLHTIEIKTVAAAT
jgi:type 1 fimbria pilin